MPDVSSLILFHIKSPLGNGGEDLVQRQLGSVLAPGHSGGLKGGTCHEKPLT